MSDTPELFREWKSTLRKGLGRLGLDASEKTVGLVLDYLSELTLWNRRYSLVHGSPEDLVIRHVLDSLAPIDTVRRELGEAGPALDLGSGAGFPGLPLALVGGLPMVLLDRSARAVTFLRATVARLGISNCRVHEGDAKDVPERFPMVVSRALSPGGRRGLETVAAILVPGGRAVIYSGTRKSTEALLEAGEGLFAEGDVEEVDVPFLEAPRHVVLFRTLG